jgi:hypothetical protein
MIFSSGTLFIMSLYAGQVSGVGSREATGVCTAVATWKFGSIAIEVNIGAATRNRQEHYQQ